MSFISILNIVVALCCTAAVVLDLYERWYRKAVFDFTLGLANIAALMYTYGWFN